MQHTKHIWRAALIFLAVAAMSVAVREFMVPESFGVAGHYRYDSIAEYMEQPVAHGGDNSCKKCHDDKYKAHRDGKHAPVQCEVCHGPVTLHADPRSKDDVKIADARVEGNVEWCGKCHSLMEARPKDFPQIDFLAHVNGFLEQEGIKPVSAPKYSLCKMCHDPHHPHKDPPKPPPPPAPENTGTPAGSAIEGGPQP